ncbi:MAG: single-stranded-DNA-specific exonuclease RecJ, partial [Verrucomicrobiota bacterium]
MPFSRSALGQRWMLPPVDDQARELARALQLSPVIGDLLWQRGLQSPGAAQLFIEPKLSSLVNPFTLTDLEAAAARLADAVDRGRRMVIYGDYDVDGITSSALLWRVVRALGGEIATFLPHRMDEGYGLSQEGLERCLEQHRPELLIAVDCGTTAVEQIAWLRERGVEVMVVDHHELPPELPAAHELVNPHRDGHLLYLASVGLVFKLLHGLLKHRPDYKKRVDLRDYMDLVAVGTVADIVPLVDDNRIFVRRGLRQLMQTENAGLAALMQVAGVRGVPTPADIGFRLGPRLNASGRLGDATRSLELLTTGDPRRANELARELDFTNRERQRHERVTHEEASQIAGEQFDRERDHTLVVARRGWHVGVIGIVASRLLRHHYRPTLVIGIDEETGMGKGSGRSIEGYSLIDGLRACADLFDSFGGHEMAAGLTIPEENIPEFRRRLEAHARETLSTGQLQPRLH